MASPSDTEHMRHALHLAESGLGRTWPNPSVGAVVVKDGTVVGTGVTAHGGRPHAEPQALAAAASAALGATLYVTLEPCAHHGQTPPCTDSIIAAGIARVVVANTDPNPKVSGKGMAQLRAAGIEVTEGVHEAEAMALNEGFFSLIKRGRQFVTLKIATSVDGKIAAAPGTATPITGKESRDAVHLLRATHDAILTGIGTVLADDPRLTSRLTGREADSPQRVVMDSRLRTPPSAKILPAWIITSEKTLAAEPEKAAALREKGASLFTVALNGEYVSLSETLTKLGEKGITRLMVEAGSRLAGEFVRQKLVDRLYWFRAPMTIGNSGVPALHGMDISSITSLPPYNLRKTEHFGDDVLEIYDCGTI
jgi:diaminohydroxyphosphoribosylaminopyrimidine deaminase/5-amino-6-(5-phosphoribosylamino)uracil reductase